jgi:two-component system, NarL family, sensor histidine kinase UhpB
MITSQSSAGILQNMPQKLHRTVQRYELLSNATREGIWDYNVLTGATYYNDTMYRIFGFSASEMKDNKDWWESNLHPEDKARIITAINSTLHESNDTWWGKYLFRCKNGTYKPILERLYIMRDETGTVIRLLGTMQDLTQVEGIEVELEQQRKLHQQFMAKKIITKEEGERKQMGNELNENINQVLASINFYIEKAKAELKDSNTEWLTHAQELIRTSIKGVKEISHQLTPHTLEMLGFVETLKEHLSNIEAIKGIKSKLLADASIEQHMDNEKRIALYRIAYSQFMNICEHSNATGVIVKLKRQNDKLYMSIADDGKGFESGNLQYGFGFSKIQNIVAAFNGNFCVASQPGGGCSIEVAL